MNEAEQRRALIEAYEEDNPPPFAKEAAASNAAIAAAYAKASWVMKIRLRALMWSIQAAASFARYCAINHARLMGLPIGEVHVEVCAKPIDQGEGQSRH